MLKKLSAVLMIALLSLSVSSCSIENGKNKTDNTTINSTTQKITVIYNNFKDVLPEFKFESTPVEKYDEGISYTFSAKCSESDYDKYVKKLKKSGFEINSSDGNGYYAAYNEENYYVESILVGDLITVFIKRT